MHKTTIACVLLLAAAGFGHKALAQDQPAQQPAKAQEPAPPEHFYHLDFVVEDVNAEGKVVNSRNFSTTVSTVSHSTNSIRSGSKIPILTGSTGGDTQFQYEDVGASFDIRNAHEFSGQIAFELTTALSSVASLDPNLHEPVLRQDKWQASVFVPIGKQTVVFSSDSVDSKGSTRVLVTATQIQ
ncbi:MAG TPA: hypothetical protein VL986_06730 [Terracidiphilus sp.]|nr:hypothetical protein [Terracidiphilus sp.]